MPTGPVRGGTPANGPDEPEGLRRLGQEVGLIRAMKTALEVGTVAPDFALHRLEIVEENGGRVARPSKEAVRLRDFRGKRPVVLLLSDYT